MQIRASLGSLTVALLLLISPAAARADIVWLENGGRIEGEIVHEGPDEIEIKGAAGTVVLKRDDIESIEKKLAPDKELEARRSKLADDDVAGRVALAQFVLDKRLPAAKAGELALEAFALAPQDGTVIELLKKKLDYKFEQGAWQAPDRWYPAHGFVRRGGNWITLELAAFLDAEIATKQARTDETAAEKSLAASEKEILAALEAESLARKELDRIKGILDKIDQSVAAAKADLAQRDTDLGTAQTQTAVAQRDYSYLSTLPTPTDPKQADDLSKRINTAQALLAVAQSNEQRARRARDTAQSNLNDTLELKAEGPKHLAAAQSALDTAASREKTARAIVPERRATLELAKKKVDECRAAELTAKSASADRRAQELKADSERDEALKSWKPAGK